MSKCRYFYCSHCHNTLADRCEEDVDFVTQCNCGNDSDSEITAEEYESINSVRNAFEKALSIAITRILRLGSSLQDSQQRIQQMMNETAVGQVPCPKKARKAKKK